ncbi:MAG: hypothetical protein IKP64_05700, partial [Selenomonadaceae bacterium]|nr:hypothetical protein [Selenomonadaceae bacterium]
LKDGTLTRAEAEEIAGDLTDEFENARKQFDAGKITQTEAQDKMRAVVEKANERLELAKSDVSDKNTEANETLSEEKALDLFTLFDVEKPENLTEEFNKTYREIQNTWDAFLDGENDILETADKINAIVGEFTSEEYNRHFNAKMDAQSELNSAYMEAKDKIRTAEYAGEISPNEVADKIRELKDDFDDRKKAVDDKFPTTPSIEQYLQESDILNAFRDKIKKIKPSPEQQEQFDKGWEIFFTLKRTFDHMYDEGKVSDDEYKNKGKTIDEIEERIQNEKITPIKAAAKLHDLLPEVTAEEIQNYLSTRNEKKEAHLLRITKDWREAVNSFYDGSLIDTDAVDRGIKSGDWGKLISQLPEKAVEFFLAEAKRIKQELKKAADNGEKTEISSTNEQSDKKKSASNESDNFHGLNDEQITTARHFAQIFWQAPNSVTGDMSSEEYLEKAVGKEIAEKILPIIDAVSTDIIMSQTPAKQSTKSSLEAATERLKETFGLQTKKERRQERDLQKLHEKLKTDTHPNLKTQLENDFAAIEQDPNSEEAHTARNELQEFRTREFTDEELDELERKAQELNNTEAAQKQSTAINPFDVEIPQN